MLTNQDARTVHTGIDVNCWIFDPPYNIGFNYNSSVKDNLSLMDYFSLIEESVTNMFKHTNEGHLFMVNYPEQSARLLPIIESTGWRFKQWISWVYPSNVGHSKKQFTKASRVITWFVKGEPEYNIRATVQPFKNPNDKRIKERMANGQKGVAHYDWWEINMRKNVSKGHAGWANQLPRELVERIILTSTKKGDMVGDLMAGAGTTLEVALPLERQCWLNDIDPRSSEIWDRWYNE
tara:strand:- start:2578 stop:3285 length:708 start_codon:yes stop_codon:yes gene_type:complete